MKNNYKEKFINDFNNIEKIKCFEFKEGPIYIDIDSENDSFVAGGCCNVGLIPEFKMIIDYDLTVEENLQNLFTYILENSNYSLLGD